MPVEGRAFTSGCWRRDRDRVIGDKPIHTGVGRTFPSAPYCEAKETSVCLIAKPVGEPDTGNPHVRFDERGMGNETATMPAPAPILDPPHGYGKAELEHCRYGAVPNIRPVPGQGQPVGGCGAKLWSACSLLRLSFLQACSREFQIRA
jgi:hypothetical protein